MKGRTSFLFVLFAALLWGTTGTAQTFTPAGAHPIVIGSVRLAVGGLTLLAIVMLQKKMQWKNWPVFNVMVAAVSMAAYQPLFFSAVKATGVAIGTVVAIGSSPVLAGILEWLFYQRKPPGKWWSATLLAITGCCLLLFSNNNTVSAADPLGITMALGAGLSFAIYTLVSKKVLEKQTPEAAAAVVFTGSALLLSPFLFLFDLSWLLEPSGVAVSLHLGVIATGAAYYLFTKGLVSVPASTAVTLSLGEPLTAALLSVFLVKEILSTAAWAGVGLLCVGIIILALPPAKSMAGVKIKQTK